MDSTGSKGKQVVRKVKKKQVKDESDRQKQAEKKKRRLEKALATSAAIISELEKKKQTKKEEQQRLDEEGAAIAEAVALHVLLGEDSDESRKIVLKKDDERFNPWNYASNLNLFTRGRSGFSFQDSANCSFEGIGWFSNAYKSGCKWDSLGNSDWTFSSEPFAGNLRASYFEKAGWDNTGISAGLVAVEAISSLQISEDAHEDTMVFNRVPRR